MVMPYRPTREDKILSKRPFRFFRGKKIDVRWQGGWLSPDGSYYPVDYEKGITHETIAEEHGNLIQGSGSITTRPPVIRLFDFGEWMRVSYFEGSSFCVELKGDFSNETRQRALLNFVRDYKGFDEYYLNDKKHKTYQQFIAAISKNEVTPRGKKK